MIRVVKPADLPAVLRDRGRTKTADMCMAYDQAPQDYLSGTRRFTIDRAVYAAPEVKAALKKAQHDKCAFCESKISHGFHGDVEHFRPKQGYRQAPEDQLSRPGYYWLAYEWGNLYLSCQLCNQRYKANHFPLADPARRARSHHDDPCDEQPLFIDPGTDDPKRFIGFRDEYPYPIGDNARAKATIAALGLGREELNEMRRDRLGLLQALLVLANSNLPEAEGARRSLAKHTADDAAYASAMQAFLERSRTT